MAKTAASASAASEIADSSLSCVLQIGQAAGAVWKTLDEQGALSLAKLVEKVGGNRDVVMQAIGWLAREDKLEITETKRGRIVALRVAEPAAI
ncbi:MAG: winged helix-turn-helix domain-containing protein [Pirellulaceae bacterium]